MMPMMRGISGSKTSKVHFSKPVTSSSAVKSSTTIFQACPLIQPFSIVGPSVALLINSDGGLGYTPPWYDIPIRTLAYMHTRLLCGAAERRPGLHAK